MFGIRSDGVKPDESRELWIGQDSLGWTKHEGRDRKGARWRPELIIFSPDCNRRFGRSIGTRTRVVVPRVCLRDTLQDPAPTGIGIMSRLRDGLLL